MYREQYICIIRGVLINRMKGITGSLTLSVKIGKIDKGRLHMNRT